MSKRNWVRIFWKNKIYCSRERGRAREKFSFRARIVTFSLWNSNLFFHSNKNSQMVYAINGTFIRLARLQFYIHYLLAVAYPTCFSFHPFRRFSFFLAFMYPINTYNFWTSNCFSCIFSFLGLVDSDFRSFDVIRLFLMDNLMVYCCSFSVSSIGKHSVSTRICCFFVFFLFK